MKSVGVVVEYNPFHNGHQFHIETARKVANADITIAVMSGNFLQRGEPALVSKWARTKMALQAGVDIVIELPYAFAVQKAETFAYGAIYLLNALHCDGVCFGSESGNIDEFINTNKLILQNKETYEEYVRSYVKQGISYPSALAKAYVKLDPQEHTVNLATPNNILGFHYVTAGAGINSELKFYTVKRKNADYHDETFQDETIASATSIRKALQNDLDLQEIQSYIPKTTLIELERYHHDFSQFHDWNYYWPFLQYQILSMSLDELRNIYEVEEGLEYRLKKIARSATTFHSFMEELKTKRYTWTRLQRMCVHILINTHKHTMRQMIDHPAYARLLGMSEKGREYLNAIKKEVQIPLISKVSGYDNEMLSLDLKAAAIYAHALHEPFRSELRRLEYSQPPIMYTKSKKGSN